MKKLLVLLMVVGFNLALAKDVNLSQTESKIDFSIYKHKIDSWVHGGFDKFSGTASFDSKKVVLSNVVGIVESTSVNTKDEKRDNHLRSKDFFNSKEFPQITFKQTGSVKLAPDFVLKGKFKIKETEKKISIKMKTIEISKDKFIIKGEAIINRNDYKVDWNARSLIGFLGRKVLDKNVTMKLTLVGDVK